MALLIKYNATENGTRPITGCGTTNPFWESPSLFIAGGVDAGTVKENQTVSLNATVWNTGETALTNVRVQMWVSDYTTLPTPTLTALPLDAMGTTIASGFVTTVPPGVAAAGTIVSCSPNWHVAVGQAAAYNGHVCLVANVYLDDGSEGEEGSAGTNPFYVPGSPPTTDFCTNPHHAQRNIAIQAANGFGREPKNVNIAINAVNPDPNHQRPVHIMMTHLEGRLALSPTDLQQLHSGPYRKLKPIVSDLKLLSFGMIDHLGGQSQPTRSQGGSAHELKFDLHAHSTSRVGLQAQLDPAEQPGNVHTFEIVQLNEKGDAIGGARLLVIVAH